MSGSFVKWFVPGLVTVVGGTALALLLTGANLASDLTLRTKAAIADPQYRWANVSFDARDAIVTGTATDQQMIDDVTARIASVHGVRAVVSNVVLAEFVSPFPFSASTADGKVTLSGGVPDDAFHADVLRLTGAQDDKLRLMSGAPERTLFRTAVEYGLTTLSQFDHGEIKLADLAISISGRAKSPAAFDALAIASQSVPPGVKLASVTIEPALAAPFEWKATFDGSRVIVTGFAPTDDLADALRAAVPATIPVSTTLSLASGEPQGFAANTLTLLKTLVTLEQGTASISDGAISLSGAPATKLIADAATAAVTALGGTITLDPPRVEQYDFTASKADGRITLTGFVPDNATLDRLKALDATDASALSLGRGAPERFDSAVEFGLSALSHLSDGTFAMSGTTLSLKGRASTVSELERVEAMLSEGAPQGTTLAVADVHPPLVNPFTWSAEKADTGMISITGYVPTDAMRKALSGKVSDLAADRSVLADGAPDGFQLSAVNGLTVLALLDSGKLAYDGGKWSIEGTVSTPQKGFAADAAYSIAGLRTAGWSYRVTLPPAATQAALPIIDPYVWRAQKSADGSLSFAGFVPADAFKRYLAVRTGDSAKDSSVLGAGAPQNFIADAMAGLDALLQLDEGSLGVTGSKWTLTGQTPSGDTRTHVQDLLTAKIDPGRWQIAIQALDAAPIVSPYLWSATKAADGSVELSGYLTNDALKKFVAIRAGRISRDTTELASGEPAGFADDVLAGLEALSHLTSGKASFDGSKWTLTGLPNTADDANAALGSLALASQGGSKWEKALSAPTLAPVAETPPPAEEPAVPEAAPATAEAEPPAADAVVPAPEAEIAEPAMQTAEPETPTDLAATAEAPAQPAMSAEVVAAPETAPGATPPQTLASVEPEAVATPEPTIVPNFVFDAKRVDGGAVTLTGLVPADATRAYFGVIAGDVSTEAMTVASSLPADFITEATGGIRAVMQLADAQAGFDGKNWQLRGEADTSAARDAVLASIAALPGGKQWQTSLTLTPPLKLCDRIVTAFADRNAILFNSGSSVIADASLSAIDELATDLQVCPQAAVHVQGHTNSDGAEDLNLVLSVARAEAVVNALIERGVAVERLYAEGFGESEPIASNDTNDGKQKNRRIAFALTDEQ